MTRSATRPVGAVLALLLAVAVLVVAPVATTPAGAQADPPPTVDNTVPAQAPRIVVEPNSGQAPTYEGQRGTTSQFVVFAAIMVGLGTIIALVARESRKKRAAVQARSSTRSDPVAETSENAPDSNARQ